MLLGRAEHAYFSVPIAFVFKSVCKNAPGAGLLARAWALHSSSSPRNRIPPRKHALALSAFFDLKPVRHRARSAYRAACVPRHVAVCSVTAGSLSPWSVPPWRVPTSHPHWSFPRHLSPQCLRANTPRVSFLSFTLCCPRCCVDTLSREPADKLPTQDGAHRTAMPQPLELCSYGLEF